MIAGQHLTYDMYLERLRQMPTENHLASDERAHPPGVAEAILLAWEHTIYCDDISVLDIVRRAVDLYHGAAWSFWWD